MSPYINFLITVYYNGGLLRCALSVDRNKVPEDITECPMRYTQLLRSLLPAHVQSCGPVVEVVPIFEVHVVSSVTQ